MWIVYWNSNVACHKGDKKEMTTIYGVDLGNKSDNLSIVEMISSKSTMKFVRSYKMRRRLETYHEIMSSYRQHLETLITREWYLPLMVHLIEEKVNLLINKVFQESPSLP